MNPRKVPEHWIWKCEMCKNNFETEENIEPRFFYRVGSRDVCIQCFTKIEEFIKENTKAD